MSLPTYSPRVGSLPFQVCDFFKRNADESLTAADIAEKFDAMKATVHTQLTACVDNGLLERFKGDDGNLDYRYRLGPVLKVQAPAARAPAAQPKPKPLDVMPDPAKIELETGIPIETPRKGRAPIDWCVLLRRMEVGNSAPLPKKFRSALGKAIAVAHGDSEKKFETRKVDAETIRVWRVA